MFVSTLVTPLRMDIRFRAASSVLRDSPESRKIPFVPSSGTNGTVPNIFRDGTNGTGTIQKTSGRDKRDSGQNEKRAVPKFYSFSHQKMSCVYAHSILANKLFFRLNNENRTSMEIFYWSYSLSNVCTFHSHIFLIHSSLPLAVCSLILTEMLILLRQNYLFDF